MYKGLLIRLMKTKAWSWTLTYIIPYVRFTVYYTKFNGRKFRVLRDTIIPGDIIVAVDKKKLTTLLIPGTFSHAAICISKDTDWEVSEMTHHGYTKSCLFDIAKECDRLVVLRCDDFDDEYKKLFIRAVKAYQYVTYDTCFTLGVNALYCSELVYQSDFEHKLKLDLSDLAGLGQPYISPDGIYLSETCRVVYDSDNVK